LLLNGNKSEAVVIGTAAQLKSATAAFTSVTVAGSSLPTSREVNLLGVMLDSCGLTVTPELSPHARSASRAPLLTSELATPIACSIFATRIDYCNSLL